MKILAVILLLLFAVMMTMADTCVQVLSDKAAAIQDDGTEDNTSLGSIQVDLTCENGTDVTLVEMQEFGPNELVLDVCYGDFEGCSIDVSNGDYLFGGSVLFNVDGTGFTGGKCTENCDENEEDDRRLEGDGDDDNDDDDLTLDTTHIVIVGELIEGLIPEVMKPGVKCRRALKCRIRPRRTCCSQNHQTCAYSRGDWCNHNPQNCVHNCNGYWINPRRERRRRRGKCCSDNEARCTSSWTDWCHDEAHCENNCNGHWIDFRRIDRSHCCSHDSETCTYNDGLTGDEFYYCQSAYTCLSGDCGSPTWWIPKYTGFAWINEFHYDNTGTDSNEFIEVAFMTGLDMTSYYIVLYNGSNGLQYGGNYPIPSPSSISNGVGFSYIPLTILQNGSPDGFALVAGSNVVEFLSYEGSFTANNGPASGLTSTDVGVSEPGGTPTGLSLQRLGAGCSAADFIWTGPLPQSPAMTNVGQVITGCI